jgi:Domain of unknown function (DUF4913)
VPDSPDHDDSGVVEPVRFPESDLETLSASVRRLLDQSTQQARLLDHLSSDVTPPPIPLPGLPRRTPAPVTDPRFILTLDGEEYENELDALSDWVDDFLLEVYGREVSTAAPWCERWQDHLEAVGRLHALWMAYQQHIEPDAGPAGPAVWHRDHLDHTMAVLRAPNGPFAACMTDPERPSHRLLPVPRASVRPKREDRPADQETAA